jgi:hypothetical protein
MIRKINLFFFSHINLRSDTILIRITKKTTDSTLLYYSLITLNKEYDELEKVIPTRYDKLCH